MKSSLPEGKIMRRPRQLRHRRIDLKGFSDFNKPLNTLEMRFFTAVESADELNDAV